MEPFEVRLVGKTYYLNKKAVKCLPYIHKQFKKQKPFWNCIVLSEVNENEMDDIMRAVSFKIREGSLEHFDMRSIEYITIELMMVTDFLEFYELSNKIFDTICHVIKKLTKLIPVGQFVDRPEKCHTVIANNVETIFAKKISKAMRFSTNNQTQTQIQPGSNMTMTIQEIRKVPNKLYEEYACLISLCNGKIISDQITVQCPLSQILPLSTHILTGIGVVELNYRIMEREMRRFKYLPISTINDYYTNIFSLKNYPAELTYLFTQYPCCNLALYTIRVYIAFRWDTAPQIEPYFEHPHICHLKIIRG